MAHARHSDPSTSHEAAVAAERSGRSAAHRRICLAHVSQQPGLTAAEIAKRAGLERHAPSRRLPELRAAGLVDNGHARNCSVQGRRSITWIPTAEVQS